MPPSWIEYGASNLYRQTSRLNGELRSCLLTYGIMRRAFGENGRFADIAARKKYSAWQMNKAIKRNSVERKKFVGVLCLFDFGRSLKDFFKRVKTALRCRVRFSRYVL